MLLNHNITHPHVCYTWRPPRLRAHPLAVKQYTRHTFTHKRKITAMIKSPIAGSDYNIKKKKKNVSSITTRWWRALPGLCGPHTGSNNCQQMKWRPPWVQRIMWRSQILKSKKCRHAEVETNTAVAILLCFLSLINQMQLVEVVPEQKVWW